MSLPSLVTKIVATRHLRAKHIISKLTSLRISRNVNLYLDLKIAYQDDQKWHFQEVKLFLEKMTKHLLMKKVYSQKLRQTFGLCWPRRSDLRSPGHGPPISGSLIQQFLTFVRPQKKLPNYRTELKVHYPKARPITSWLLTRYAAHSSKMNMSWALLRHFTNLKKEIANFTS